MAVRSMKNKTAKKPKEVCLSRQEMKFDVQHFYFAVSLETEPFGAPQAAVVDRNANTFQNIPRGLSEKLGMFGMHSVRLRYIVFDMSTPFTIDACGVFNNLGLPEYMATLIFAAKIEDIEVRERTVRTFIRLCEVHQHRAIWQWAQETFKAHTKLVRDGVRFLFQSVRFALVSSKTYHNLCVLVGFLNIFYP